MDLATFTTIAHDVSVRPGIDLVATGTSGGVDPAGRNGG
jgi:hypothetical protein